MSRAAVFAPSFSSRHVTNVPLSCDRRSALFECWQSGWTADSRHAMQRRAVAMGTSCTGSFLPICTLKLSIMYLLHAAARCEKDEARRAQTGSAADRPEARAPLAESAIPGGSCSFARAPVLVSLREPRPLLSPACTRVPGDGRARCSPFLHIARSPGAPADASHRGHEAALEDQAPAGACNELAWGNVTRGPPASSRRERDTAFSR